MDIGLSLSKEIISDDLVAPVVHAEADYINAINVEDVIEVTVTPTVGDTSITFRAVGERDGETMFRGHLVTAFVDGSRNSVQVPNRITRKLEEYSDPA